MLYHTFKSAPTKFWLHAHVQKCNYFLHACRYLALCFCLPTWTERILFFAISHACFGIINLQVS